MGLLVRSSLHSKPLKRIFWLIGALGLCAVLLFSGRFIGQPPPFATVPMVAREEVAVTLHRQPLPTSTACSGTFVTHKLPFANGNRLREISTYISNGSGVAVNDLDGDGDLDLVFASVDSNSGILWNEGGLSFRQETLDDKFTRAVATVDVDGDGLLDIVFTHRGLEPPSWWRNMRPGDKETGREGDKVTKSPTDQSPNLSISPSQFVKTPLVGIDAYAYSMGWADLNSDGTLDLVTGSYGAELKQQGVANPEHESKAGVFLYLQEAGRFEAQQLDNQSEALSVALLMLDTDKLPDIWVANDFALQDMVWLNRATRWIRDTPFAETSHSTMNIDWGNIDNAGELALFTTDMNPYDTSTENLARWLPMMAQMGEHRQADDPQVMANTLQLRNAQGRWVDEANALGVDASGWSWASRFGDLDNDGFLDLYVVNGMIAHDMFAHLHNDELIEENQAYHNRGDGSFERAPQWNLASTASGRGMVMADLDGDGDLDIVVNNLRGFAELHENQLCSGANVTVDLRWEGSVNRFAVGAKVLLQTSVGLMQRDVRASGGYLSGDSTQLYFGLPQQARIHGMEIIWPDGKHSMERNVEPANKLLIIREEAIREEAIREEDAH